MTYQLPTDADGVKYHGREYDDKGGIIAAGVDEHGNDKPILINTDGSLNMQSVVQELHDIKQRQQEILERLDDPIDTRVTGSKVERIELLPATSLRDTSTFNGDYIDTDKYEKMLFFVNSTLDAEVYIAIRIAGNNIAIWKDGKWANTYPGEMGTLVVEEGRSGEVRILNTKYEWLNTLWSDRMQVRVRAKETPTEGSISIYAFGVI